MSHVHRARAADGRATGVRAATLRACTLAGAVALVVALILSGGDDGRSGPERGAGITTAGNGAPAYIVPDHSIVVR